MLTTEQHGPKSIFLEWSCSMHYSHFYKLFSIGVIARIWSKSSDKEHSNWGVGLGVGKGVVEVAPKSSGRGVRRGHWWTYACNSAGVFGAYIWTFLILAKAALSTQTFPDTPFQGDLSHLWQILPAFHLILERHPFGHAVSSFYIKHLASLLCYRPLRAWIL